MALSGVLWDVQIVPSPHLTSQIECAMLSKGMLGPCSSNVLRILCMQRQLTWRPYPHCCFGQVCIFEVHSEYQIIYCLPCMYIFTAKEC